MKRSIHGMNFANFYPFKRSRFSDFEKHAQMEAECLKDVFSE